MQIHNDLKCLDALQKWRDVAVEAAYQNALSSIDYELYEAPVMTHIEQLAFFAMKERWLEVVPQKQIGKYRVDFFIEQYQNNQLKAPCQIVIECDGHDWHEKTKEQAAHDKKRDRDLQSLGFKVYHFTGSEIWKTNGHCIADALWEMI